MKEILHRREEKQKTALEHEESIGNGTLNNQQLSLLEKAFQQN